MIFFLFLATTINPSQLALLQSQIDTLNVLIVQMQANSGIPCVASLIPVTNAALSSGQFAKTNGNEATIDSTVDSLDVIINNVTTQFIDCIS